MLESRSFFVNIERVTKREGAPIREKLPHDSRCYQTVISNETELWLCTSFIFVYVRVFGVHSSVIRPSFPFTDTPLMYYFQLLTYKTFSVKVFLFVKQVHFLFMLKKMMMHLGAGVTDDEMKHISSKTNSNCMDLFLVKLFLPDELLNPNACFVQKN